MIAHDLPILELRSFFTLALGLGLSLYLTPLAIRAAHSMGVVCRPDGGLRDHEGAVPYLGGVAVYLALLISLTISVDFTPGLLGLLLGTAIVLMTGLIDDFGVMTARMKLFGQFIAILALIKGGIFLQLTILDVRWPFEQPFLLWGLTLLWGLALANALNFLDIEDGLSAGVAAACCPALFVVAWWNGRMDAALFTAGLFGAILGFLRYNLPLPKARIYLGDAGSLLLGVSLAALAMIGSYTEHNDLAAICPVLILGVPCFEIMVTMAARWRKGVPVWYGSPDHIAKRLQAVGVSKRRVLALHVGVSLLLGALALFIMRAEIKAAVIAVSIMGVLTLIAFFLLLRIKTSDPRDAKENSSNA